MKGYLAFSDTIIGAMLPGHTESSPRYTQGVLKAKKRELEMRDAMVVDAL